MSAVSAPLHTHLPPLPMDVLVDIATGIAAAPLWRDHLSLDPDERRPVRLLATARYEVWVIGWTHEQGVAMHDHGDSAGVFAVTSGTLTEVTRRGPLLHRRELGVGSVRRMPVGFIHDVVNVEPTPAASIHVYSPPLSTMNHYDIDSAKPVRTEVVLPEPTALGAHAGSALLHPAGRA